MHFIKVEAKHQLVLDQWVAELRDKRGPKTNAPWYDKMKLPFSGRVRIVLGFALWIAVLLASGYYLSTHKIKIHITSKIVAIVFIAVVLIVFVILPVYAGWYI